MSFDSIRQKRACGITRGSGQSCNIKPTTQWLVRGDAFGKSLLPKRDVTAAPGKWQLIYFPQKTNILGFMMSFGERNWHGIFSRPRMYQCMGRPGAERYVAGFSPTDSATDSAKRIFVPPTSLPKINHLSILLRRMNIMMRRLRISFLKIDHWLIFK